LLCPIEEDIKINKGDLSFIIKDFVMQIHANKKTRSSAYTQGGASGRDYSELDPAANSYNIDWNTFKSTIIDWVRSSSQIFLTIMD
jgi:hypothetical protein